MEADAGAPEAIGGLDNPVVLTVSCPRLTSPPFDWLSVQPDSSDECGFRLEEVL